MVQSLVVERRFIVKKQKKKEVMKKMIGLIAKSYIEIYLNDLSINGHLCSLL